MTVSEFIAAHGITMEATSTNRNPNMESETEMDHWRVTFRHKPGDARRVMTTYFSMGVGLGGAEPEAKDVLHCLAIDASGIDQSFEDWCGDYGYDTDSRKAERIYKACQRSADKLKTFLGHQYEALLECEEG